MARRLQAGKPHPLGAHVDANGANFALFSAHADKVELCLFDHHGHRETERIALPELTDGIWHGYIPEAHAGMRYAYRVHGPYDPAAGHRFNPFKLLLDPYAREIAGELRLTDAHFGYRVGSSRGDRVPDRHDNARMVPKCVLVDEAFSWGDDRRPRHSLSDTVIYELHAAGYTRQHPAVDDVARGTFAGLRAQAVIDHLRSLGVTAVELLPIHCSVSERSLVERGLTNYWRYNSIGFFAPDPRLLGHGGLGEFKRTVAALHAAGLEVLLDVVYNHTAEGNNLGPTLSFRGIDNASYYWLNPEDRREYLDFTGCGNSLQLSEPRVLQMVIDSLRYWVEVMHVDGFRFDLASTLARTAHGFDPGSSFLAALMQDPVLSDVKLIAEPWDVGPGGYQLGHFSPGWSEWNDRFRDVVRQFWRGDGGVVGETAMRLMGSADIFRHDGRKPTASVNFVTAHDGFTLADLVSYNEKHNEANLEGDRDGHSNNLSWNCGVEGPTDVPEVLALRRRQRKNLLATLLLSQGVPMLLAGDEIANSQSGNNNAYCQDNPIGWIDWRELGREEDLSDFIREILSIRRSTGLSHDRFLGGGNDNLQVVWLRPDGKEMTEEDWHFPDARFLACAIEGRERMIMFVLNGHHEPLSFSLPSVRGVLEWCCVLATAAPADGTADNRASHSAGGVIQIPERSLTVFVGQAPPS
jgi:isoamylase